MKRRNILLTFLGALSLVSLPMPSQADSCSDIREQYLNCVGTSMTSESCDSNISIPPECLHSGDETIQNYESSSKSTSNFFGTKKESPPLVYQINLPPKKPVKVINIKPTNGKIYLETEEDVDQYVAKIKDNLSKTIKEGKRVRLKFQ